VKLRPQDRPGTPHTPHHQCFLTLHHVQAKNSALAAAGAIVPGSFEEFEGTIRWVESMLCSALLLGVRG